MLSGAHVELLFAIPCELVPSERSEGGQPVTPVEHRQICDFGKRLCDVLMDSPEAVLMRMTRHARSRRVNKQYEAMAVVRCSACCLGASASTDARHLLLRGWDDGQSRRFHSRAGPARCRWLDLPSSRLNSPQQLFEQWPALLCQQPLEALGRVRDIH